MRGIKSLLSAKRKYAGGLLLLIGIWAICLAFSIVNNNDFDIARREILLREIGHNVLLQSADSTSRVLPVKKIGKYQYQLSFENTFTFQPDGLVKITQFVLARDPLSGDYVVNVISCANSNVTYGYAISKNKKNDIIACIGRKQPVACYKINITFKPAGIVNAKNGYLAGGLSLLAFAGFLFMKPFKSRSVTPNDQWAGRKRHQDDSEDQHLSVFTLGSTAFDAEKRKLITNANTIELTKTEARVLHIFALSPNEVIERSRLQKEIWENEGVIVGRSLDMFISKLRKKLDPSLKIVVIRGKGYRLETSLS